MDTGFRQAAGQAIQNPLPTSWLGRADAPVTLPSWAQFGNFTKTQLTNLQAQIGYAESQWDYQLVGSNNELGRYQITPLRLEQYGLLIADANAEYGSDCVNFRHCWKSVTTRSNANTYVNYIYNTPDLRSFLQQTAIQDHLSYQIIYDLYLDLGKIDAILSTDGLDVIAGMIYVAWKLGVGSAPDYTNTLGTGAYAWRYSGIGNGTDAYNSGRYAINVLGQ